MSIRSALALGALALVVFSGCGRHESLTATSPSGSSLGAGILAPSATGIPDPGDTPGDGTSAPAVAGATVYLPAGSVNGLAAAIAAAGPGGRVIVRAGSHTESASVLITAKVQIEGEPGAVITSTSAPSIAAGDPIDPALHVRGAGQVKISGLEFQPSGGTGNTAILLEDAPDAIVSNNRMSGYQFGVVLQEANRATIDQNTIAVNTGWQVGAFGEAFGITVINGDQVKITGNDVSGGLFNIWACDVNGSLHSNFVHDGFIGIILCKVPAGGFVLPGGQAVGADGSAAGWMCRRNVARGNFDAGYLVIDGAHDNMLVENAASNNGTYDIDLAGDSYRFGFLTPSSFRNMVRTGSESQLRIKNCGSENTVIRGNQVDTSVDTCS